MTASTLKKLAVYIVLISVAIAIIDWFMMGRVCHSTARMDSKIVLVTGANTGIGKETALDMVKRGAKVYMACRSMERCNAAAADILSETKADKSAIVTMFLDLGSLNSVRQFAIEFKRKEHKLHVLINNAGIMLVPQQKSEDGYELTFAVNHLGHFLLTNLLMNELAAAAPSRIVTVSSHAHVFVSGINWDDLMLEESYSSWMSYCQSKLANVLFSRELAKKLKGTGITTYSLHPGAVVTELGRHVAPNNVIMKVVYFLLSPFFKDAMHGAQTQICCAVAEELASESGKYYDDCREAPPSSYAQSDVDAERLWNLSLALVKLDPTEIHPLLQ